jgi:hypothetical protein
MTTAPLVAEEAPGLAGKWLPEQVLALDADWLAVQGLAIAPDELWSREGAGLLAATVSIDGCSAGFVSADGLLVTNHHCALTAIQQHSTPERDLLKDGFLAASRDAELPLLAMRATVPSTSRDVTAEVLAAVPAGADDLARQRAIERRCKELVARCEATPNRRCQVAAYDGGVRWVLDEGIEYRDVRLVWAPPYAVGNFGGEVDNWSWPRHTGDFALLRVWAGADGQPAARSADNRPLRPRHHYQVAPQGVADGGFVMITGYPGVTYRSLTAAEMAERVDLFFPRRADLYAAWIRRFEAFTAGDEATRIALAARLRTLENREKNARGQLVGLARGGHYERRQAQEAAVEAWVADAPSQSVASGYRAGIAARDELARLATDRRASWERDFLLDEAKVAAKPLDLALTLVRWAAERAKPDLDRQPGYQDRDRAKLAERLTRDQTQIAVTADADVLADWLLRLSALPAAVRPALVEPWVAPAGEPLADRLAALLRASVVLDPAARSAMLDESVDRLVARHDGLLDFALALDRELLAARDRADAWKGAVARLRPGWRRVVEAHAGRPLAPDANGTLRVAFGHVQGYSPREAVWMRPRTTLAGLLAKVTGEVPFDYPAALLAAAQGAASSPFADPALGSVPVAFLADLDTTGGNSGSPVLDGRGRLVGVNFDRVWENVANDFGFDPAVARNVSVDIRYLLWTLVSVHGEAARPLLAELGI